MAIQYFPDRRKFTIGLQEERFMSIDQANAMRHERNLLKDTAALEPGPLDGIDYDLFGREGHGPGILLRSLLSRDSEWSRVFMSVLDRELAAIATGHGRLTNTLAEIERIFANRDLTPEGKVNRSGAIFETFLAVVDHWLVTKVKEAVNDLQKAEELVRLAEKPEKTADEDASVRELRRSEVRTWFFSLPDAAQAEHTERFGQTAQLGPLDAIRNDPAGRLRVSKLILDAARVAAIRAQGGDFILVELMDARDVLHSLRWRAGAVSRLLRGWAADKRMTLPEPVNAFESIADEALARSEDFLRVVEDR